MTKTILFLALITIIAPFTSAQFSQNFTSVQIGVGTQGVHAVPMNITDPDGTQYFELERNTLDEPEGEWTLELIGADGTSTTFLDQNNDLVVVNPDGSQSSLAGQIPPLLGITGPELVQIVESNVQAGVNTTYSDPTLKNITNAEADQYGNRVVDQVFASSGLPPFFLTSYKAQAYQQINESLVNAQTVSAAINASLTANQTNNTGTAPAVGQTVTLPLNLTSFDLSNLNNVKEITAGWGNETVDVILNTETSANGEDEYASWAVTIEQAETENGNNEWTLNWVDIEGNTWNIQDSNGNIVVVGGDGSQNDYTNEANWYTGNENGDLSAAIGDSIEDFVDAVIANIDNNNGNVVINVGPEGLNWTYPATEANSNV